MRCLVTGAGGFVGGHLVRRLLDEGHLVRAIDWKPYSEWHQHPQSFGVGNQIASAPSKNLQDLEVCFSVCKDMDWVFNLAADMGGMGFIENNKLDCMLSSLINTHMLLASSAHKVQRFFFSSSACVYPGYLQNEYDWACHDVQPLRESDAYPADPEDGYGWEKLFAERMCRHFMEDRGIQVRIGRYHNVYGPNGTFEGGREKAPAALCRKIAQAVLSRSSVIEVWGDGHQTRSFTYIDDCIEGTMRLMQSDFAEPLNIGSSELVTIKGLVDIIALAAGWSGAIKYVDGPQGVRGRNSDNTLAREMLGWEPSISLKDGIEKTYDWIFKQISDAQAKSS